MAASCTYTFTDPNGQQVTLTGQAAIKAWLVAGGLEYLRGAANDAAANPEILRSTARDLAQKSVLAVVKRAQEGAAKELDFKSSISDIFDQSFSTTDEGAIEHDKLETAISRAFSMLDRIPEGPRKTALKIMLDQYEAEIESAFDSGTFPEFPGPKGENSKAMRLLLEEALRGAGDARASKARDITDTPEFKKWFGDSKVVDADGKPLVVYHGTKADFASFVTTSKSGDGPAPRSAGGQFLDGRSMFFATSSADVASDYASGLRGDDGANVMPLYVSLQNPLVIDGRGKNWARYEYQVKQAYDSGKYDGVIVKNVDDNIRTGGAPSDVYVAFKPTQLKSATGNRGTFDPADPDITRSAERFTEEQRDELERAGRDAEEAIRSAPRNYDVDLSAQQEAEKPAKAWIEKVYANLPRNPMAPRQRMMMFGEDDFALLELAPSGINPGGVTIQWIQAYPLRSGNGTKAIRELQRLAAEDGIELDLWPWDKGRVSQASLIKFYKSVGFEQVRRGSKDMIWRPGQMTKEELKRLEPMMDVPNSFEFQQRLQWLSEGMLRNNLYPSKGAYKISQEEIDLYRRFRNQPGSEGIRRSAERGLWYSQLSRAIESVPARLDNQSGVQWAQWLKANASKLGVKQDEITWSGIEDFLKIKGKAKVSKDEIGAYLAEGGVRVEEVRLGDRPAVRRLADMPPEQADAIKEIVKRNDYFGFDSATEAAREYSRAPDNFEMSDRDRRELDRLLGVAGNDGATKYGQYTLPGGANYREVLLTLPVKADAPLDLSWRQNDDGKWAWFSNGKQVSGAFRSEGDREAARGSIGSAASPARVYKSTHWDQKNILAHIRLNDRTDADGRRVLFVEELQSDWGADARKKGIIGGQSREAALAAREAFDVGMVRKYGVTGAELIRLMTPEETAERARLQRDLDNSASGSAVPAAPFIDDTTKWLNLALKRVIKMAVDEGYDAVSFVTGEQSADRYDLSKQLDSVLYDRLANGKGGNVIGRKNGSNEVVKAVASDEEVADVVGKEVARKLLEAPKNAYGMHELKGLDLKVGGEGMKAFYDQIVPQAASALVKKMGGEGMTTVSIAADSSRLEVRPHDDRGFLIRNKDTGLYFAGTAGWVGYTSRPAVFGSEKTAKDRLRELQAELDSSGMRQPGFLITPAMREKASGPMPLFSRERAAWTDDRIDRLLSSYAYTMDDEKSKAYAGFVSPEDYLRATTPASSVARLESENKPLDAAELRGQAQPIMLIGEPTDAKTWKTTGHEGRHRMMALRDAGVRRVPVVFQVGYGLKREPLSSVFVTAQRWSGGPEAQGGFTVESLTPISYKYAKELKKTFGGNGDIRFSRERTETPEFKAWFKDSKVVNPSGQPKVMYHATYRDFGSFEPAKSDWSRRKPTGLYYFTDSPQAAESFAGGQGSIMMPVYLSASNPFDFENSDHLAALPGAIGDQIDSASGSWSTMEKARVVGAIKRAGFDAMFVSDETGKSIAVFEPTQIKSAIGNDGSYDETDPSILSSAERNWSSPGASKFDDVVYKMQNRQVDLLRVQQAIQETGQQISEDRNTYLREELFHGRAAKRTQDFTKRELEPLTEEMAKRGLTLEELDEYLHARHAPEANRLIAERNPDNPLLQDGGSGLDTALAQQYMSDLTADKKAHLEAVAAMVDKILAKTRQLMVDYELESKDTVKGWGEMFQHYVPLMREDDGDAPMRLGSGQGYSIRGREVKSRTGSTKKVVDILANIAMQRERVIVRGEKNRVGQSLVNLARENGNKDFWTVDLAPTIPTYDPKKGVVVQRPDPMYKMRPNVVVAKFREEDGSVKEHAVIFNENNARAMRTAAVMKNLEMDRLEGLLGASAAVTRYFAAINTQWNPVFGVVNFIRDFQNVLINLKSTPLDGKQKQIARDAWATTKAIYTNLRSGKTDTEMQKLWDEFQSVGGQTGFRQMFADSQERADDIRSTINPDYWMDSKLGKIFTANGVLKVPVSKAAKAVKAGFQWLTDYNDTLENSMRLAVYKAGKESGMSKEDAASLAKNISVNFNRKGQVAQQAGALYAFFNAASQGTARLGELLFTMEPGQIKTLRLSRVGKRIVAGGVLIGVAQALALAMAGYTEDDPPQFLRERSLIIPTGDTYISIPMPLGLHVLPNLGRVATEWAMSGFKDAPERAVGMIGLFADAFNPIGNAGLSMQTIAPTVFDPLVALTENRDWQGRPISKESMNPATPGHALARDTATSWAIAISKGVNTLTGGNDYVAGAISPSPDAVDYILGQITGGVGREISKVEQTITSAVTGEELPSYKIPLFGRFGGSTKSQASEGTEFYASTRRLNELETEIKGLQKDGKFAEAAALRASRPESYLIAQANRAERDISSLRREKSRLVKAGAPREQVRAIEEKITQRMAALNRAVEDLSRRAET